MMPKTISTTLLLPILTLGLMMPVHAQDGKGLSLDTKPGALEATPFTFPKFEEFTLENGLHVFVVENHQVPTVTFSLVIRGGEAQDPAGKSGVASMTVDMLGKGTKSRTAQEIAQALDGVGASISGSAVGESVTINGSALKKHATLLFSMLGDQLTQAAFDPTELEKMREQYLAGVASEKADAQETADALSRKVLYGFGHPIANRATEQSVKAITRDDLVAFSETFLVPSLASIAVVGDVSVKEVKDLLKKHLSTWKTRGTAPDLRMPERNVAKAGVYFVPREGSVQSAVVIGAAIPGVADPDHLPLNVTASYFGSSFGSILFETLRETYSYTYSPFGYVTRGGAFNRLATGAEVRASVTDSAITVILNELNRIGQEGPDPDKLERRIGLMAGQYRLAFERAATVAAILQNAWVTGTPIEMATTYDTRLESVSYSDVQRVARRYFGPFDLRIVVVGPPNVREKLEQFGPIYEYTLDLEPASADAFEPVDLSVEDLVAAHLKALGGQAAVEGVRTAVQSGTVQMKMSGREMSGTYTRKTMAPNKEYTSLDLGMMKQVQWFNGTRAWLSMNNGSVGSLSDDEVKAIRADALLFPAMALRADDATISIKGKKKGQIHVDVRSADGTASTLVFDEGSMLLDRIERTEVTPKGPILNVQSFRDYQMVGGVQFPSRLEAQNAIYSMVYSLTTTVNEPLTDADFEPETK